MHPPPETHVECPRCHGAQKADMPPSYFEGSCHLCEGTGSVTPVVRAQYLAALDAPTVTKIEDPGSEP